MANDSPWLVRRHAAFVDHDIALDVGLAGEAETSAGERTRAPLTEQVLPLISPHGAEASDSGEDLHGAVGALAVPGAADRPKETTSTDSVEDGIASRGLDLNPERFYPYARHAWILSCD